MRAAAPVILAPMMLALAACAGRPASLPPPVDAAQVTAAAAAAPRPAEPPPPAAPANPRLPPNPELVALPGGRTIPQPPAGGVPAAPPQGETAAPAHGAIQRPPALPQPPAEVGGCFISSRAVAVRLSVQPPQVMRDRNRASLASMTGREAEGGLHVAGLYRAGTRIWLDVQIAVAPNGCLLPSATVQVDAPRGIYVASEFAPGSCRYEVVLSHEREHARIDDVMFTDLDGWLAAPLRQVLAEPGALRGTPQELNARLRARFEQARVAFNDARRQSQLSIDTPQEYARASRACGG